MMTFWHLWRRLVLSAVNLNQIFHTINIFNLKKAHNNDKKHMFAIFALFPKDAKFGYSPLPTCFSLFSSTDLKDGYRNFMVSYAWSVVFFFAISICLMSLLCDERKLQKI